MRVLIVEDDFVSRTILHAMLSDYGECDIAVDGAEAIAAFDLAWQEGEPYELICMDIIMPRIDGQEALQEIRKKEGFMGLRGPQEVKVIMTTALDDTKDVVDAFRKGGAASYLVKPIRKQSLIGELRSLGLLKNR